MGEEIIDQFNAMGDSGEIFTVLIYQRVDELHALDGSTIEKRRLPHLVLLDGRLVNPTDDPNTFQIVETDEIIRKV